MQDLYFDYMAWVIPLGIFFSGAALVTVSYLLGRRALERLLRLVTRTFVFYLAVQSGEGLHGQLDQLCRANNALLLSLETVPCAAPALALLKVRVKIFNVFRAKGIVARLRDGTRGFEGVQDFYEE